MLTPTPLSLQSRMGATGPEMTRNDEKFTAIHEVVHAARHGSCARLLQSYCNHQLPEITSCIHTSFVICSIPSQPV